MGKKIRIYELAQKLGLENKVLLKKLQDAGIEAKSHMSVLEESDLEKFDTGHDTPEESTVEEKIEERRITPGIIRRRRTEVPRPAAAEAETAESVEEEKSAPAKPEEAEPVVEVVAHAEEVDEKPAPVEKALKDEVKAGKTVVADESAPGLPTEVAPEEQAPVAKVEDDAKETAKPAAEAVKQPFVKPEKSLPAKQPEREIKATATQAKILGRVELPHMKPARQADRTSDRPTDRQPARQPARPGDRSGDRQPARPGDRPGDRQPARPAASTRPESRRKPSGPPVPVKPEELFVGKEPGRGAPKGKKVK
jgi:translation initiation factor IF-2